MLDPEVFQPPRNVQKDFRFSFLIHDHGWKIVLDKPFGEALRTSELLDLRGTRSQALGARTSPRSGPSSAPGSRKASNDPSTNTTTSSESTTLTITPHQEQNHLAVPDASSSSVTNSPQCTLHSWLCMGVIDTEHDRDTLRLAAFIPARDFFATTDDNKLQARGPIHGSTYFYFRKGCSIGFAADGADIMLAPEDKSNKKNPLLRMSWILDPSSSTSASQTPKIHSSQGGRLGDKNGPAVDPERYRKVLLQSPY
jgi:hypothetical protein